MAATHTTPFAGSWYPGRRDELDAMLDRLFDASLERTGPSLLPRPLAFVVPHAGLSYSGTAAASAYRHLQAAGAERVFLLGFTHRGGRPGVWIPETGEFRTPLGDVRVEESAARELTASGLVWMADERRVCDHSVEIQLPLLQRAVPGVPVVPLYVGPMDEVQRNASAQALAQVVRPGDVLMASSDLTHYGREFGYEPFPADSQVGQRLFELDSEIIAAAGSLDSELFLNTLRELDSTACGYEPIALLLKTLGFLAQDDVFQQTLDYQTSGDVTGDFKHSVSYGSLGYFRADSFCLDKEAQRALMESARATLRHLRETGERESLPPSGGGPALLRRANAFVSLHQGEELFGCIGTRSAESPLSESIPELTLCAAMDDPRFSRRRQIPDDLQIEISVLTPMKRVGDWNSFRFGRDGAMLEYNDRRSLLLPQVAGHGVSTATGFLEALSRKAGLRSGAYREPQARLSVFRAQVFSGVDSS
jgi:MEMO1 family protein